jgi:hypothetical protein
MQVLIKASLPRGATRSFSQELFTFKPDPFSLDDLLAGRLRAIKGTLYRGNFEAGGEPIQEGVRLNVKQIPRAERLSERSTGLPELEYIAYGTEKEAYLVHPITKPPDFDRKVSP